jgi:hypothetical protein
MFYLIFSFLIFSFIVSLLFGSLVKYYYDGGKKYSYVIKIALFLANIPLGLNRIFNNKSINPKKPPILTKHKEKKRFQQFIKNNREGLLVLPRYDHSLSRAIVDIICLNEFKIIHTYKHDISFTTKNKDSIRFGYYHPLLLEDGSLISESTYSPLFKIDFQSNLQWINDEIVFHHSKAIDHEKNIWIPGRLKPFSKYVKKFQHPIDKFRDDAIVKINTNGKILFKKSVIEILIENKKGDMINSLKKTVTDPIHLNCIEPAFSNTKYWKKGDLFLSLKHHSAIILYRPNENKIINYITGPFSQQHDVDIISDNEISIFNNNNFFLDGEFSEVLIYNFQTKQFSKLFNEQLKKENFKTYSSGMSQILKDGALMVEEQNHGRIILFNNKGEKEWEFVNKDKNENIGEVSWSRVIEDDLFVEKFKSLVQKIKC